MAGFKERLRKLDSHSSVSKEFRVYTVHGAALSVVTCLGAFLDGNLVYFVCNDQEALSVIWHFVPGKA